MNNKIENKIVVRMMILKTRRAAKMMILMKMVVMRMKANNRVV